MRSQKCQTCQKLVRPHAWLRNQVTTWTLRPFHFQFKPPLDVIIFALNSFQLNKWSKIKKRTSRFHLTYLQTWCHELYFSHRFQVTKSLNFSTWDHLHMWKPFVKLKRLRTSRKRPGFMTNSRFSSLSSHELQKWKF